MKINIIDSDSLIYAVMHNKKDEEPKTLEQCYSQMDIFIRNIIKDTNSTHYIMYLTVGRGFRYQIYPSYKSNRKHGKPEFFDRVKEYLITDYKAKYINGYEADDLCLSSLRVLQKEGKDCFISSPDKDILMLEGVHYNYLKKEWVETNTEQANYNFYGKLIWGDASDGVSGLKGKGEKYVQNLFADTHWSGYPHKVFQAYVDYHGEQAIEELYKTKKLLKILDEVPGLIPEVQEFKSGYEQYKEETNDKTT